MKYRTHLVFTLMLVIGDALAILLAYILAYIVRVKISDIPTHELVAAREYFLSLLILLPFIILMFSLIGTYTSRPQSRWVQIGRVLFGSLGAMLFLIAIDYFHNTPIFPAKLVPLYGFGFSIVFLSIERSILYFARFLRRRKNIGVTRVVVVGLGETTNDLLAAIKNDRNFLIQAVVGGGKQATHRTWRGAMRNFNPQIIIQVATAKQPEIDSELLDFAKANYIEFKFVPREINQTSDLIEPELFLGAVPMMTLRPTALNGWGRFAKRAFDFSVALIGLIIASPFMLIVWLVLVLSGGSPIYRRKRLTRFGDSFTIYKFRSLKIAYNGIDPEAGFKKMGRSDLIKPFRANGDFLEDDPRISKFGKFIRKFGLDELPQLLNVLKGDISLVGPRALIAEELNQSNDKDTILNVKSGLTSLAVVAGRKETLPFEQRRKLDVYYVQNWSFALDIQILFRTFVQVLAGRDRGA